MSYYWNNWELEEPEPEDLPCAWCGKIESEQYGRWNGPVNYHFFCSDNCLTSFLNSLRCIVQQWTDPYIEAEHYDPFSHI